MNVIHLNNKVFVKHNRKAVYPDNADGAFKKKKYGVVFYDKNNSPQASLVANRYNEQFFVTAHEWKGKVRYMFGFSDLSAQFLGFDVTRKDSGLENSLAKELWKNLTQSVPA